MLINSSAYDKVLTWDWDKHWLFDFNFINNSEHFRNLFLDPPLALQHSGKSDTNSKIKNFTNINNDQATYSLNKIKELERKI